MAIAAATQAVRMLLLYDDVRVTIRWGSCREVTVVTFGPRWGKIVGASSMSQSQKPGGRKPATKFAHLRKKMEQNKLRTNVKPMHVRKSGNR
jgi:hypothetical protein